MTQRQIVFSEAVLEATKLCMEESPKVYLMGLGVSDPQGIFGTSRGLKEQYPDRVVECPTAENGVMGVGIGSALLGMRPIITHQRVEFALLAIEQLINQAAKWNYMTDGASSMPIVIRLIVGRGWGQGPQHSQSLEAIFAHVPGLKVVTPSTPENAKGLLIAAVRDDNPVVIIEHRWLHRTFGTVDPSPFTTMIGKSYVSIIGIDITIVSFSFMSVECRRAAEELKKIGINVELIDLLSLRPLDADTVIKSVEKTGRLLVVDNGWPKFGVSAEILAAVVEAGCVLETAPQRLGLADVPIPSTKALANLVYPNAKSILAKVCDMLGRELPSAYYELPNVSDVPDKEFMGPF